MEIRHRLIKLWYCLLMFCFVSTCLAQKDFLYVQGNQLKNKCNESVILRGVNYSVLDDWSFPANLKTGGERLSEIVKSGANAVRIQWYENYNQTGRPAYTVSDLDSLLTRCARYQMIPIIGLWDLTCSNDWPLFNQHVNWWLQPSVVALLKKHRSYAILNITNEFGEYEWTGDTTTALYIFTTNYSKAVKKIRQAGISVPIMIDAPDCGQNVESLVKGGSQLIKNDSLKSILLSVHSYWYFSTNNDSAAMAKKVNAIAQSGLPFVFGEVANYQTVNPATPCQYALNYQRLLPMLKKNNIGWLAWTWFNDYCSQREMADSGLFRKLNFWGNDLINNANYGLKTNAVRKSCAFTPSTPLPNNFCVLQYVSTNDGAALLQLLYEFAQLQHAWLEQSEDGIHWQVLQDVAMDDRKGQTNIRLNAISQPIGYLRVKYVDAQGKEGYSNTVTQKRSDLGTLQVKIWPNPAKDKISLSGFPAKSQLTIYNVFGKPVLSHQAQTQTSVELSISGLSTGNYFIRINTPDGKYQTLPLIKQ